MSETPPTLYGRTHEEISRAGRELRRELEQLIADTERFNATKRSAQGELAGPAEAVSESSSAGDDNDTDHQSPAPEVEGEALETNTR
jgi:hypothetical protein